MWAVAVDEDEEKPEVFEAPTHRHRQWSGHCGPEPLGGSTERKACAATHSLTSPSLSQSVAGCHDRSMLSVYNPSHLIDVSDGT